MVRGGEPRPGLKRSGLEQVGQDIRKTYSTPGRPSLNQWGLGGSWNVGAESAILESAPDEISFRFFARDLHMVLSPAKNGTSIPFKLKMDGEAPGNSSGVDSGADWTDEILEPRLSAHSVKRKGNGAFLKSNSSIQPCAPFR